MTLHQQHLEAINNNLGFELLGITEGQLTGQVTGSESSAVACSEISKEYAKGFVEFVGKNNWQKYLLDDYTWWRAGMKERASTDELLSLYDDHLANLEKEKIK